MISDELKHEIECYLAARDKGYAARQELIIHEKVSKELKELEEARRGRLQFLTAVGGVGALAIAGLLWESISNSAVNAAAKEVAASKEQFNVLVEDIQRHSAAAEEAVRRARAAENNVNERLKLLNQQLLEIDRALGEVSSARGQVTYLKDMVQLQAALAGIQASLDDMRQSADVDLAPPDESTERDGQQQTAEEYFNQQKEQ